ncbi:MAG: exodeoxyribonuclease V subunit gamma [Ruminococcus sp.]|nr:exodeoxyribonuclease V subunit gamma [Ruminococcus sp.]
MLEFITGPSGSGKTSLMTERIRGSADSGREQCIIVPEQYSYEFDKKLYKSIGAAGFNELFSLSFTSLARELFQHYGRMGRKGEYAGEYAKMIMIYEAVSAVQGRPEALSFFRRQSSQSGFADEVLGLISDMKRSGIRPEELREHSAALDAKLMDKTLDVASIYSEYERLMAEYGFKDNLESVREAAGIAAANGYFKGKTVFLDEFESFTGDQIDMIKVMISSADDVVMTLRTDDVSAGKYTLFETVNKTFAQICQIARELHKEIRITPLKGSYRFATPDLAYLSEHVMRNFHYTPAQTPAPERIRIFEARDMYSEAEFVCATMRQLIFADKSLRYRDMAVISNDMGQYAEVLKAAFARYDIPFFLSMEKPVGHTSVMTYFTSLLDLLTARKLRSEQVFRMIKCGISGVSPEDSSLLENYCYKWGVDGDMWDEPFAAPDPALSRIEALRKTVAEPVAALKKKLSRKSSAQKICALLYEHLTKCQTETEVAKIIDGLIRRERDTEAAELKRLWGCLMEILDSVAETLGEKEVSFSEIAKMMKSMIGRLKYSEPPQTLDGVSAASARTARLSSPRVVFVMGCTDGSFPNQVSLHGLFSEGDKQKLAKQGIKIARPLSDLIAAERLIVYKSLSAASERLYMTYPLSDLGGQACYPSPVIDQTIAMFGREDIRLTEDRLTPDYYAVTLRSAYYHYIREMRSATAEIASIKEVLTEDPEYRSRIEGALRSSRHSHSYKIDKEVMAKLKDTDPLQISPSALDSYNSCPFSYFCSSCLRLKVCEEVDLDARIAGDMAHECFCGILSSRTKEEFLSMSFDQIRSEVMERACGYRDRELAGEFGKTPRFPLIFDKVTERLSEVFVHTQHSLMASSFAPADFELDLRKTHPVEIQLGEGRRLSFGGIIDRVDTCEAGGKKYIRIIDYKSSRRSIDAKTLAGGINLQMLIYLFAATDKGGLYEGYEPAGVLYSPIAYSEVKAEAAKDPNVSRGDSELKASGLVLSDEEVVELMEHGGRGRFVPVKLTGKNVPDQYSSVISAEGLGRLKDFVYRELSGMAEALLDGQVPASPLKKQNGTPCVFCDHGDICGVSDPEEPRLPDEGRLQEAAEILKMNDYKRKEGD